MCVDVVYIGTRTCNRMYLYVHCVPVFRVPCILTVFRAPKTKRMKMLICSNNGGDDANENDDKITKEMEENVYDDTKANLKSRRK